VLGPGDEVLFQTPGGGGFGPPLERNSEALADDVRKGYVSQATARDVYGQTDK
jgi:N-methylhydantoinase B